jgi:hypothetical protein
MNRIPMAERLVWASVVRPRSPIVYLDLNHFILMARVAAGAARITPGYRELLEAVRKAVREERIVVPLSAAHLFEMAAISDPSQRAHLADVMEELSGFRYLLGRMEVAELEVRAGFEEAFEEQRSLPSVSLIGPSFGWSFGMRGGVKIVDEGGRDASVATRREMGDEEFDAFMAYANRTLERQILAGPSDEEAKILRAEYGYNPELALGSRDSRLAFELDLSARLTSDPSWRRGRLRDVVSAREITHEFLDVINRVTAERVRAGRLTFGEGDPRIRIFMASMPHVQIAISMKTRYHRDPNHRWTTNDITDIDALSVAYAYCDVVFTDRAARAALVNSTELRVFSTRLPRTPQELVEWIEQQPRLATRNMLVPHPVPKM